MSRRRLGAGVVAVVVSVGTLFGFCGPASAQSDDAGSLANGRTHHQVLGPIAQKANSAANIALAQVGDPYHYGATGPAAFDCSGLSMWSYDHAHLSLPRTAAAQYASVRHEDKSHLMRGDLVFFHDSAGHVYHVGIFLYWNAEHRAVIVHAPHTGERVHREAVWTTSWYAGTRRH